LRARTHISFEDNAANIATTSASSSTKEANRMIRNLPGVLLGLAGVFCCSLLRLGDKVTQWVLGE
jgi:hypothetical protein